MKNFERRQRTEDHDRRLENYSSNNGTVWKKNLLGAWYLDNTGGTSPQLRARTVVEGVNSLIKNKLFSQGNE